MARTILLVGAVAWLLLGVAGIVLAATGTEALLGLLPPLAIDADALGGAITAIGLILALIGAAHAVVVVGLGRARRWAMSAGALLGSILAVASIALGAAAVASALRETGYAAPLLGAGIVAIVVAGCYGLVALRLTRALGSGPAS